MYVHVCVHALRAYMCMCVCMCVHVCVCLHFSKGTPAFHMTVDGLAASLAACPLVSHLVATVGLVGDGTHWTVVQPNAASVTPPPTSEGESLHRASQVMCVRGRAVVRSELT